MEYRYKPNGVCSSNIKLVSDKNKLIDIEVIGGCNGNLKAISKLLEGATVEEIESKLRGNTCGRRPTSCTDQLAIAVRKAYDAC